MARTTTKSTAAKDADTTEDTGTPVPVDTPADPLGDPSDNMTGDPRPVDPVEDTPDPAPGRPAEEDRPARQDNPEDDPEDTEVPVTFVYHLTDGTTITQKAPPGITRRYAKDPGQVRVSMGNLMGEGWVFVPSGQGSYNGDLINADHVVRVEISR